MIDTLFIVARDVAAAAVAISALILAVVGLRLMLVPEEAPYAYPPEEILFDDDDRAELNARFRNVLLEETA